MARINKLPSRYAGVPIAVFVGVASFLAWMTPLGAVTFEPPGDRAPKQANGGASRNGGQCPSDAAETSKSLTPLIPGTNLGLTIAERPTLFAYIPATSAKQVFFSIQEESGKHLYQTMLPLPASAGAIGIPLPKEAPPLQVGKNYLWSVVMVCGEELEPDSPMASGWIRRTEARAAVSDRTEAGATLEAAAELAEAGIWYDTLAALAQLRRSQPENAEITANWQELLQSVGLEAIATEPLVN